MYQWLHGQIQPSNFSSALVGYFRTVIDEPLLLEGPRQKRTYVGWVNKFGDILVGGIDHNTGKVLPEVTLKKHLNKDDHANPSLMILQVKSNYYRVSKV